MVGMEWRVGGMVMDQVKMILPVWLNSLCFLSAGSLVVLVGVSFESLLVG